MTSLFKRIDMVMELTLRELRPSPGSSSPVFLPLFDPRIPCEKSRLFQNILKIGIILKQGLRNPVADGNGLPGDPSSLNIHLDIELIPGSGELKGLKSDHFTGLSPKVFFQRPLVDDKLSFSGFKPNPCDGSLSLACGINRFCHVSLLFPHSSSWRGAIYIDYLDSSEMGFWASWG